MAPNPMPIRPPAPPLDRADPARFTALGLLALTVALTVGACAGGRAGRTDSAVPRSLLAEARPIGRGPRFHPAITGRTPGACRRQLGRRFGVHVEVFASDRVVLLPAGIGVRGPKRLIDGRVTAGGCYGALVTLDPTGVVLIRDGEGARLAELFAAWGESLSPRHLAGFHSRPGHPVTAYVDGRAWVGHPGEIPLTRHAEIVLEIGPHVPPHRSYTFPPGL